MPCKSILDVTVKSGGNVITDCCLSNLYSQYRMNPDLARPFHTLFARMPLGACPCRHWYNFWAS